MSRSTFKSRDIQSPHASDLPLSLAYKPMCPCFEKQAMSGKKHCSLQCQKGTHKPEWTPAIVIQVWRRDRGVCKNCGLDTVTLHENARKEILLGGMMGKQRAGSMLFLKGYSKSDGPLMMWRVVKAERKGPRTVSNSITICLPCYRKSHAYFLETKKIAEKADPTLSLFPDLEEEHHARDEGYSS